LFECLAHLDYLRRFGLAYFGPALDAEIMSRCQSDLFPVLAASRTVLEVNTSAIRRGLEPYYPRIPLINAARRAGVDVHFLGSDAHRPEDVGWDFDMAAALASQATLGCDPD
jgi:histidinol-phosphatase (PHP family)